MLIVSAVEVLQKEISILLPLVERSTSAAASRRPQTNVQYNKLSSKKRQLMPKEDVEDVRRQLARSQSLLKEVVTTKLCDNVITNPFLLDIFIAELNTDRHVFLMTLKEKVGAELLMQVSNTNGTMLEDLLTFRDNILEWLPDCHGKYLKSTGSLLSADCLSHIKTWVKAETGRLEVGSNDMYTYDESFTDIWRITFDRKGKCKLRQYHL